MTRTFKIGGLVTPMEMDGLRAGVAELKSQLSQLAPDLNLETRLGALPPGFQPPRARSHPDVFIASLLPELGRSPEAPETTESRWRDHLTLLQDTGATVFICTVYRHIGGIADPEERRATLERVRRLNLLAVNLSHSLGVGVIDLDRAFAERGADVLKTDHRLNGRIAAELIGHTVLSALLSMGLDAVLDPGLQETMRARIGGSLDVMDYLRRRLKLAAPGVG